RDPADTYRRHKVEKSVPVRSLSRRESELIVKDLDVLIVGGGGILYDFDAKIYLREAQIAYEKSVPTMFYAVGAGPLNDPESQKLVREVLNYASIVTVRDKPSFRLLEDIGVLREIVVTADPAFNLQPDPSPSDKLAKAGIGKGRKLIGMSVREPGRAAPDLKVEHYHRFIADAADYLIERYNAQIVFIPMERKTLFDLHHSYAVIAKMVWPQFVSVLDAEYTPDQIMRIMKELHFVVGMRLHFLIFAALQNIPFVPLPYSGKIIGFLEEMGLDMPPFENITSGRIITFIDKAWDQRDKILDAIKQSLPGLKKRAQQNNTLLIEELRILAARKGQDPNILPGVTPKCS
ncbi:MAG: polysaccharide pyruvyl transferase, partial [Fibrobacter sp.]|nr:polysaccharide pyruvyl transferase [Fibrobacter sp.]